MARRTTLRVRIAVLQKRLIRPVVALSIAAATSGAQAMTLTDLRDSEFHSILGSYAPKGDCGKTPRVELTEAGLAFTVGSETKRSASFEYALSFFGPDYDGISKAIFPFPETPYEPGPILMYANADEKPGHLAFEENLGPGETLSPLEAALVQSSPLLRCATAETKR